MTFSEPPARGHRALRVLQPWAALAGALAIILTAGTAFAQAEEAEALIRQGMALRKEGQDARAMPLLEKAYKLSRTPRTAAQLGLVQMALGYWVESEQHLNEALGDPDNSWVARNRAALDGARTRVRGMIGEVTITGQPPGAEVLVNGRSVGRLPLATSVRIGKGPVEVELRADGYASATRSLVLAGGGKEQVNLTLARAGAEGATAATADGSPSPNPAKPAGAALAAADRGATRPGLTVTDRPAPDRGGGTVPRGLAWASAAVAAAGLAVGVAETFAAQIRLDAFNQHRDPSRGTFDCTTSNLTQDCTSLRDDYNRAKLLSIVGYASAGVFAATSVVLFVLSSPSHGGGAGAERKASPPATMVLCAPTLASAGATCALRF